MSSGMAEKYLVLEMRVNERIIAINLKIKGKGTNILQVYAPEQGKPREENIDFHE